MNTYAFMFCLTLIIAYMFLVYDHHRYFQETVILIQNRQIKKYDLEGALHYAIAYYIQNKSKITNNYTKKLAYDLKKYSCFAKYLIDEKNSKVTVILKIYDKDKLYAKDKIVLSS